MFVLRIGRLARPSHRWQVVNVPQIPGHVAGVVHVPGRNEVGHHRLEADLLVGSRRLTVHAVTARLDEWA